MRNFVYIAVGLFLLTSLMPSFNYSAPSPSPALIEVVLASPGASKEELRESEAIIINRLRAFGIAEQVITSDIQKGQIILRFDDKQLPQQQLLTLLSSRGQLEFREVYPRDEALPMLQLSATAREMLGEAPPKEEAVLGTIPQLMALEFLELVAIHGLPDRMDIALSRFRNEEGQLSVYALKYDEERQPILDGEAIKSVSVQPGAHFSIGIKFDEGAAAKWAEATRRNKGQALAMVMDGLVYFAPKVAAEITSGETMITGTFSEEEARSFAAIVEGGELPVPFKVQAIRQ